MPNLASTVLSTICITLAGFAVSGCALIGARQQTPPTALDWVPTIPNLASLNGCPIAAWAHDQNLPSKGYLVTFKDVSSGQVWKSGTTNAAGRVNVTVPSGIEIQATIQSQGLTNTTTFTCPAQSSTK
jgi:hypothetical protein